MSFNFPVVLFGIFVLLISALPTADLAAADAGTTSSRVGPPPAESPAAALRASTADLAADGGATSSRVGPPPVESPAVALRASRLSLTRSQPLRLGVVSPVSSTPAGTSATRHDHSVKVVVVLANIASIFIYLSPSPSFWRMRRTRITAGYDMTPHVVTLVCCLMWTYYGILESRVEDTTFILINNGSGVAFQIVYIILYLCYSAWPARIIVGSRTIFALVGYATIVGATYPIHGALRIVAVECIVATFSLLISGALLAPMVRAIRDHDVEHMPLALTCAVAIAQLMWSMYGVIAPDAFILYPNAIGFFIGLGQVVAYVFIRARYGRGGAHQIPA